MGPLRRFIVVKMCQYARPFGGHVPALPLLMVRLCLLAAKQEYTNKGKLIKIYILQLYITKMIVEAMQSSAQESIEPALGWDPIN